MFNLFSNKIKVYVLCDSNELWHKVITYKKPNIRNSEKILGPFRSEVEAEELCDRLNMSSMLDKVHPYNSENYTLNTETSEEDYF